MGRRRRSAAAAIARSLVARAALLSCPAETLRLRLPHVATAAAAKKTGHVPPPAAKSFNDGVDDDNAASKKPSAGHPWGPGPDPERLWASSSSLSAPDQDDDEWAWLPSAARRRLLDSPAWPSPKDEKEALAAAETAWEAVEKTIAESTASPAEILAALWRRSEMNDKDVTPLDDEEATARDALRAAVEEYRATG